MRLEVLDMGNRGPELSPTPKKARAPMEALALSPAMKFQAGLPTCRRRKVHAPALFRKPDVSASSWRVALIIHLKRKQMPGRGMPPGKPADRLPT
jgi:hypothetical protein